MRGTKSEVRAGVWRLRVVTGYDQVSGRPRQASRTFTGSTREADSALAAFVTEVDRGTANLDGHTTLADFLERWLDTIEPNRSPTTMRGYRDKAKRINAELGRVRLRALTAQQLDRTYRGWLDEGLSPNTVHHLHALLSAALHQAAKWSVVSRAVTEQASPPPLRVPAKRALGVAVVRDLVATAEETHPTLAAAVAVAATTGLRRGELLGLRWGDVDADLGVLHVRRAIKHGLARSDVVVGDTKTHQERVVSLDAFTTTVLATHRARQQRRAAEAGVEMVDDPWVFAPDLAGAEPMRPDGLGQAFSRLAKRVGVDLTLHDLRHFAATTMIAGGIDVRTVAGRLGHADPAVTLKVYASFVQARDRQAADLLGGLVGGTVTNGGLRQPALTPE